MATDEKCATDFRLHADFVQIPRWLLDEFLPINGLPAPYFRVILFLIRKLLGWGRREDFIPLTQIERGACVTRRLACEALRFWTEVGVLEVSPIGKRGMNNVRLAGHLSVADAKRRIHAWISARQAETRGRKTSSLAEPVPQGYQT